MRRFVVASVLFLALGSASHAQNPTSDSQAISLAQQALNALTGGAAISDVTLTANVTSILGSDYETGTATLKSEGTNESRVDLNLSTSGIRSDVRNLANGTPGGAWETNGTPATAYAAHNCWTDATWFFPALSSLTQTANQNFVFKYIGLEQHGAVSTQHIQVSQVPTQGTPPTIQVLSAMDFYLEQTSLLPVAIAFEQHPDDDMSATISSEIEFADYRNSNGIQVPFHVQRMLNGGVVLDVLVTSAAFNTGLPDSLFQLY
jgi:hypothetical protein